RFSQEKYKRFANITQLMIFSNNSEYDDNEIVPLEGTFYAASDYRKLFFNRFREEDSDIYNQIAPLDEVVEKAILKDTNYLSIRATNEYETNKSPLTPTNKILTSLFSRKDFYLFCVTALLMSKIRMKAESRRLKSTSCVISKCSPSSG
ncbi:MAG: hypothetical protein IKN27_02505, partial [Selenomonadaceae bacterium]|nr:hypothetical protein [Selenomonadaceae bacterium]